MRRDDFDMKRLKYIGLLACAVVFSTVVFHAAKAASGTEEAVKAMVKAIDSDPKNEGSTPELLIKLGTMLEGMVDAINTKAERECFRSGGSKGAPCMKVYAEKLNALYGKGSYEYNEHLIVIKYTGVQYKRAADEFPKSKVAPEADYLFLSKNLVGRPDEVLPRITDFMKRYPNGEWGRRGLLLWARINEDIWWVHRKWAWILYGWSISPEELIVKAEPYRQEALRSFQKLLVKDGRTEEGRAAKKEYELLKKYEDDGRIYGIINESDVSGTTVIEK